MTIKEIYEKTKFGISVSAGIQDYNVYYAGDAKVYLEMYNKAFRKNAAQKYRDIKALLDKDAVVVETNYFEKPIYTIFTKRSIKAPFGRPLDEYQKIIVE